MEPVLWLLLLLSLATYAVVKCECEHSSQSSVCVCVCLMSIPFSSPPLLRILLVNAVGVYSGLHRVDDCKESRYKEGRVSE